MNSYRNSQVKDNLLKRNLSLIDRVSVSGQQIRARLRVCWSLAVSLAGKGFFAVNPGPQLVRPI